MEFDYYNARKLRNNENSNENRKLPMDLLIYVMKVNSSCK